MSSTTKSKLFLSLALLFWIGSMQLQQGFFNTEAHMKNGNIGSHQNPQVAADIQQATAIAKSNSNVFWLVLEDVNLKVKVGEQNLFDKAEVDRFCAEHAAGKTL